jgi:hypothetical protein
MLVAVADTHAVIWYIFADRRLSETARTIFEKRLLTEIRWLFLQLRWLKLCISVSVDGFHLRLWLSC